MTRRQPGDPVAAVPGRWQVSRGNLIVVAAIPVVAIPFTPAAPVVSAIFPVVAAFTLVSAVLAFLPPLARVTAVFPVMVTVLVISTVVLVLPALVHALILTVTFVCAGRHRRHEQESRSEQREGDDLFQDDSSSEVKCYASAMRTTSGGNRVRDARDAHDGRDAPGNSRGSSRRRWVEAPRRRGAVGRSEDRGPGPGQRCNRRPLRPPLR